MTATKIRQSEFAATHKLLPCEVKTLRDAHRKEGEDFWSEIRAIYWTEEAAEKIRGILLNSPTIELPPVKSASVHIIKLARNPRWVYGTLDGERINVACGKHAKRILGKEVSVQVSEHEGITIYTYNP